MTKRCVNCTRLAAERDAAVAEAAALREVLRKLSRGLCGTCYGETHGSLEAERILATPSEAVAALERRLARAEALAELVPRHALLLRLADAARYNAEQSAKAFNAAMVKVWHQVEDEARALAARIEEARQERGQEDDDE